MLFHVCPILHAFMTLIRRIQIIRLLPKGGQPGWSPSPSPPSRNRNLKNTDFADMIISNAISQWNREVTGVLEFWKIKLVYIYIYIDFFLFHSGLVRIGGFQGARKFGRGGSIKNREYLLGERKRGKKRLPNASPWIKKYM